MPKQTRSVRLTDAHHRFIDQSSFDFGAEVRDYLTDEQVRFAAGICAACGELVYIGGSTVTSGGSPLGNHLGLQPDEKIDLCDDCADDATVSLADTDAEPPALDYRVWWGDPLLYRADRDAIADAQPDGEWTALVTEKTAFDLRSDRLRAIVEWSRATDFDEKYRTESVSGDALLASIHDAASDEDDLRL